ncbi:MAG: right-handed parallel beta-helix repeat-containing protein, partial [Candidatus Aenigmarchaeota archaeon]|nr:right-handed parallel beta-helix repeat-containing protein [Candidatus Aenigmarchaeota archaeon]
MLKWLFLFLFLLPLAGASFNCTVIGALPYTISSAGYYCINRSLSSVTATDLSGAVTINADNVIFDCQGSAISGTATLDKHGIYFNGTTLSSAKNCRVSLFDFGVFLDNSKNATISNITSDSNEEGFVVEANGSIIGNSSALGNNGNGFLIELYSYENLIANSTSSLNTLDGYAISLSSRNFIFNSFASNNSAGFS